MSRPDYSVLPKILEQMNKEGGFTISSLVRDDGFSIASAVAPGTDRDIVAAVSGFISDSAERVRKELKLGDIRDISIRCTQGKAVFKKIGSSEKQALILAAVMPRNVRYHSRPIGKAATKIRRLLKY
ncbi:MAG: roadblock/LC7 domain-containing protein [Candidatus Thorarchaeota archaeon]